MGKTMRWLKSLLGVKTHHQKDKTTPTTPTIDNNFSKQTRGFIGNNNNSKWFRECNFSKVQNDEQSKHAIAVATATAAAADAALMAAHAAVAVVRLTSHRHSHRNAGGVGGGDRDRWAAVRIQSIFRGYLARRAHRALKGLVKLQAHVRGFLVRKRAAATLNSMQAMVRAQATVHSLRANQALAKNSKIHPEFRPRKSTERYDETKNDQFHSKRLSTSYEPYNNSIEGSPKIVEIDTFKPKSRSRRINNNNNNNSTTSMYDFSNDDFQYPTMSSPLPYPIPSRLSIPECQNINHTSSYYDWSFYGDEYRVSTAQNTPRFPNSVRSNVPLTPTKSVCGDGVFRPRSSHPSYMGDTQSFRAKLRSHSAPKQRPEGRSKKRLSLDDIMASRNSISGVRMQRSCSQQVQENLNF